MNKFILVLAVIASAFVTSAFPQKTTYYSQDTLNDLERLRDTALVENWVYDRTAYLTNNIGPRLSGSPQAARAVEYVAEEMRKLGLEVTLQELKVPHWERGEERAELVRFEGMAEGSSQRIVLTALGGSVSTGESGITADIVVVGSLKNLKASVGKRSRARSCSSM